MSGSEFRHLKSRAFWRAAILVGIAPLHPPYDCQWYAWLYACVAMSRTRWARLATESKIVPGLGGDIERTDLDRPPDVERRATISVRPRPWDRSACRSAGSRRRHRPTFGRDPGATCCRRCACTSHRPRTGARHSAPTSNPVRRRSFVFIEVKQPLSEPACRLVQSFAKRHPHELLEHPVHVDQEAGRAYRSVAELERCRREDHAREKDRPLVMAVQVRLDLGIRPCAKIDPRLAHDANAPYPFDGRLEQRFSRMSGVNSS